MNSRVIVLSIGLWAACLMLTVGGGCGPSEQRHDYANLDPALRLLTIEADGPGAPGAVAALDELLQSPNLIYRAEAGQTLGAWAAAGNPGIAAAAITHRDALVRSLAQASYIEHNADGLGLLVVQRNVVKVPASVLRELALAGDPMGLVAPKDAITPLLDTLRKGLYKTPQEAVLAADVLIRVHDAGAQRIILQLLQSGEDVVLAKATRACARDDMDLGTTFLPQAFGDGVLARRAAMESLVLRPNPWLVKLALKGLKDNDPTVRHNAIRALGNMDGSAPVEPLAAMLATHNAETIDVIQALSMMGKPAAGVLRDYIRNTASTPALKMAAMIAFAPYADRGDIAWVTELVKSSDKHIRASALVILGRIGNPEAQAAVVAAAKDPEPLVRNRAAKALGQMQTVYASTELLKMLDDADPLVRSMAAQGLGYANYVEAVPALKKLAVMPVAAGTIPARFDELSDWPQLMAIGALGKIGGAPASATLRDLLKSDSWLVRAAAAQALGATNDRSEENAKALDALQNDSVNLVKAEARLSLKALGRDVAE
jgi:hypothetical protein